MKKNTARIALATLPLALFVLLFLPAVALAEPLPDLQVSLLRYEPSPVQPGQTIDLWIEVANEGNPTTDAWLELVEEYPLEVLPSQDLERAKRLSIVSGTQELQFRLRVDESADDGIVPLRVRYGASRQSGVDQEATFDIVVQSFDARIGIESVVQDPASFEPGSEGTLSITIVNYDDRPLSNIDLLLDMTNSYDSASNMNNIIAMQAMINARLEEISRRVASGLSPLAGATPMMNARAEDGTPVMPVFSAVAPTGQSTLTRISALAPGESRIVRFTVRAVPEAAAGITAIPLFVNYNDEDNNPFHVRTEVPVTIDMAPDVLLQMKTSTLRSTDFEGEVTLLVANRGLSPLRFTNLELLEGESYRLLTAPSEVYLNTLEPGDSAEAVFMLLPEDELLELPVRVTFRDSFNNLVVYEEMLELEIINRNYYRDMSYEMMLPWIILGLVVLALTGYFLWSLSKKS